MWPQSITRHKPLRKTKAPARDPDFLAHALDQVATATRAARITVVLGTERLIEGALRITSVVLNPDGTTQGWQDKVQLDPSEDALFSPGIGRLLFQAGELRFSIAIYHEGWCYPETVRAAVLQGAHLVFHPHYHWAEPGSYAPNDFADPANTLHEKAILCRAAEYTMLHGECELCERGLTHNFFRRQPGRCPAGTSAIWR